MPPVARLLALAVVGCLAARPAAAAAVVLGNATSGAIAFELTHPGGATEKVSLGNAEYRAFGTGRHADVTFTSEGKPTTFRLEPYSAYVFSAPPRSPRGKLELTGIELVGPPVAVDDVPDGPPMPRGPVRIPVKLLADNAERRPRPQWEPVLRRRFAEAADVVKAHTGVALEVAAVGDWQSAPRPQDIDGLFAEFERAVQPDPARVAVGYSSRTFAPPPADGRPVRPGRRPDPEFVPYSMVRGPLAAHVLVREIEPRSEPERVEVLVQNLGFFLGAMFAPDPNSAMRPRLGDGRANSVRFRIGYDPLNTLAMNIWAEELAAGTVRKLADLRPPARARLARVYGTLLAAMPEAPMPEEYRALLTRHGIPLPKAAPPPPAKGEVVPPAPEPKPPAESKNPRDEAVRAVVRAVTAEAKRNAARPTKFTGDDLTDAYIKAAAAAAAGLPKEQRTAAFLLGVGLALDDSPALRDYPLTAALSKAAETDADRQGRIAALGGPTVRARRDLCQHFAVSAALAEATGPLLAEQQGLAKELLDLNRPSGFSFTDLCADLAGVELATRLQKDPDLLAKLGHSFRVADYVPAMDGLKDGLSAERFKQDYGSVADPRFAAAVDDLRRRVAGVAGYQK